MTYEQYRRWIIMGYPDVGRGPVIDLVAGSFSGGTAVLFTYPLDLVRTKLAYQIAGSSKMNFQGLASAHVYRGIRHCFWMTYKESGIRGLYRGAAPSLYGIFPYAGLKFYFYEEMKRHVPKEHKNDIPVKLVCESIAGLMGQTITYPLDVVRRKMFARLLLFGCKWHLARDLLVDSDQLSLGESLVERNRVQKYANLSENLLSSEVSERSEKQSYKAQASDKCERSFGRKRGCGPSIGASISDNIETSQPTPHCYDHDDEENTDPSARVGDDHLDMVDVLESVEGTVTTLGKSVDTKFHKLDNHLKTQSSSFNSIEDYNGMLCGGETLTGPTEPRLVEGQEMYCSDEVGNDVIGKNERMGTESDIDIRQGNSFAVVDPIPIPGPPGSFLPSPRDMGSDDFQGNSSLTTSRVQSSQDQLDLVDGDSSDSPISATSTISNSTAARSNLKYSESLSSVGAHEVQDKRRSFFFSASIEASVKNADVVPQTTGTGAEKSCIDGEKFKANKIYIEKRPPSFKNDGQPCCCQRKEHISQDIAPDFQESQLLKRWTMASMKLPAMGKQIGCSPNARPNNLDARILGMFSWWFFLYLSSVWFRLKRCNLFSVSRYQLVMLWPP